MSPKPIGQVYYVTYYLILALGQSNCSTCHEERRAVLTVTLVTLRMSTVTPRQHYGPMELEVEDEEEVLLATAVIATSLLVLITTKRRQRRHWVRPINQRRSQCGAHTATLWLSYWSIVVTLVTFQVLRKYPIKYYKISDIV